MILTDLSPSIIHDHAPAKKQHWQAKLQIAFSDDQGVTRLTERDHTGPLRVQKPLYPEGQKICHAIIIHPPGGVVGGDELSITAKLGTASHALITTPGAAKWYRSNGYTSQQHIHLLAEAGSKLEWLPQETIFFDDAQVDLHQTIQLAQDACYIGSDILCFGRTASGESYHSGKIKQHTRIERAGKLIWNEQGSIRGGSAAMSSRMGLAGNTVCATVIASPAPLHAAGLQALRDQTHQWLQQTEAGAQCGVSQLKSLLVARYLGNSSETAKQWMTMVWQHLRPALMQEDAIVPRIWNT